MKVNVLHVDGCPSLDPLMEVLHDLVAGRGDITLSTTLVSSTQDALRLGFHGSPTILIDGSDPFPWRDRKIGLSCRIYPDGAGRMAGYPMREMLAEALRISP